MNIRSVTCFVHPDENLENGSLDRAAAMNEIARASARDAGYVLQTTRLAAQPLGDRNRGRMGLRRMMRVVMCVAVAHEHSPFACTGRGCQSWLPID